MLLEQPSSLIQNVAELNLSSIRTRARVRALRGCKRANNAIIRLVNAIRSDPAPDRASPSVESREGSPFLFSLFLRHCRVFSLSLSLHSRWYWGKISIAGLPAVKLSIRGDRVPRCAGTYAAGRAMRRSGFERFRAHTAATRGQREFRVSPRCLTNPHFCTPNFARYRASCAVWLAGLVIENTAVRDRPLIAARRPSDKLPHPHPLPPSPAFLYRYSSQRARL